MFIRNFIFITGCALLFASAALAAPQLVVDHPTFDFGTIPQGKVVEHEFTFHNRGNSPLLIVRTRTSCGCTVANVSAKSLPPGARGEIKATFDSGNFSGAIHKTIYLETNDPKTPVFNLTLQGAVQEVLTISPRDINLGVVKTGSRKEVTVTVKNQGARAIRITAVRSPLPQVTIKGDKTHLAPGESAHLSVTVTPRRDDRFISGYISIFTDIPGRSEFLVPLYGTLAH